MSCGNTTSATRRRAKLSSSPTQANDRTLLPKSTDGVTCCCCSCPVPPSSTLEAGPTACYLANRLFACRISYRFSLSQYKQRYLPLGEDISRGGHFIYWVDSTTVDMRETLVVLQGTFLSCS